MSEVTLRNGVWVHEIEWAAVRRLIDAVEHEIQSNRACLRINDAYWAWRNSEMDIEESTRTIRSLTNLISELTTDEDDVTVDSVL